MTFLLLSIILFSIHALLVFTTNINIYPEFFVFPWLVRLGYLPYRDFFDQHGFPLYYILAPFTVDKSLVSIKIIYFILQTFNLSILLIILRRTTNKIGFLIAGLLYILASYYTSENNLWYEIPIAFIYANIYLLTISKHFKGKLIILALLASLASMIKPTAAIVLIPLLYIYRSRKLLFYFSLSWMIVGFFFLSQHGFNNLIDNLFLFNRHYATYFFEHPTSFINHRFAVISSSFFLLCIFIIFLQKKLISIIPLLLFVFSSSVFLLPIFATYNLAPLILFYTIFVAYTIKISQNWGKYLVYILVAFYILLLAGYTKNRFSVNAIRIPYIERETLKRTTAFIKTIPMEKKNIYVLGTQVELYFLLDKMPTTYFPFIVPWLTQYYPNIEQRFINEIKMNDVQIILIPQPIDPYYREFFALRNFIAQNYLLIASSPDIQVFTKK